MSALFSPLSRLIVILVLAASIACMSGCGNADESLEADNEQEMDDANIVGMDATLQSFANVAGYDLNTAIEMMAKPSTAARWRRQNLETFESPIRSKAFFDNPFFLLVGKKEERWLGGIYNLWINKWLLLEFEWQNDIRADRITKFAWIAGNDQDTLDPAIPTEDIPARLQDRLNQAMDAGKIGASRLFENQSDDEIFIKTVPAAALEEYVGRMRAALAPQGAPALAGLRRELDQFYEQMEAGEQEWVAEIKDRIERPSLLSPVYLTVRHEGATIVLSAPPNPYQLVFVEFEFENGNPVFKRIDFHELSLNKGNK